MKKLRILIVTCVVMCSMFLAAGSAMAIPAPPTGQTSLWEISDLDNNDIKVINLSLLEYGIVFDDNQGFAIYVPGSSTGLMVLNKTKNIRSLYYKDGIFYTKPERTTDNLFLSLGTDKKFLFYFYDLNNSYDAKAYEQAENSEYLFTSAMSGELVVELHDIKPSAVPIPASVVLFGTGLAGLVGLRRRRIEE